MADREATPDKPFGEVTIDGVFAQSLGAKLKNMALGTMVAIQKLPEDMPHYARARFEEVEDALWKLGEEFEARGREARESKASVEADVSFLKTTHWIPGM